MRCPAVAPRRLPVLWQELERLYGVDESRSHRLGIHRPSELWTGHWFKQKSLSSIFIR